MDSAQGAESGAGEESAGRGAWLGVPGSRRAAVGAQPAAGSRAPLQRARTDGRCGPYLAEGGAEHGAQPVEERVCLGRGSWSGDPATRGSLRAPEAERRGQPPFLPIPPAGRRQRRLGRRSGRRGRPQRLPGPAVRLGEPAAASPHALLSRRRPAQGPPQTGVPGRRWRARAGAGQPAAGQPWLPGRAPAGNPAAPARRSRLQQRRLGLALGDVRAHRSGAGARMAGQRRHGAAPSGPPGGQRAGRPAGAEPEDALEAGAVPGPLKCGPVSATHVTAQPLHPESALPGGRRSRSVGVPGGCPRRAHPLLRAAQVRPRPAPFPAPRPRSLASGRLRGRCGAEQEHKGGGLAKGPKHVPSSVSPELTLNAPGGPTGTGMHSPGIQLWTEDEVQRTGEPRTRKHSMTSPLTQAPSVGTSSSPKTMECGLGAPVLGTERSQVACGTGFAGPGDA